MAGNGQIRLRCMRCWTTKVRSPEVSRDCPKCGALMRHRTRVESQSFRAMRDGTAHLNHARRRACWYRRLTARQVAL